MSTVTEAWQIMERGRLPDTIKFCEVLTPKPLTCEVQVQVLYAGLNAYDTKLASLYPSFIQRLPRTPASDFAGVITAVGPGAQPSWATQGQRVYGLFSPATSHKDQKGSLQEIVTISTRFIQPTPDDFTDEDAAGVSLVGLAAVALTDPIKKDDRVLIIGGSTSVGFLAADIAFAKGASYIVATASAAKAAFVKNRGVDDTIDYRQSDAGIELVRRYRHQPFDLILDCIGSRSIHSKCARFLTPSGTYLSLASPTLTARSTYTGPEIKEAFAWNFNVAVLPSYAGVPRTFRQLHLDDTRMEELGQLVNSGVLHPVLDREFTWEEAPKAYDYLMEGRATGKVIVQVGPPEY